MHSFSCRCSGEMHELYPPEERMQLLSSRSAATTSRRAVESFIEVVNGHKNRICVVFSSDPKRTSCGYGIPPSLPAACDASDSEHAASWSENLWFRCLLSGYEV